MALFTGPFAPQLPSRLGPCRNPAASRRLLAAERGREREEIWGKWRVKDEQHNVFYKYASSSSIFMCSYLNVLYLTLQLVKKHLQHNVQTQTPIVEGLCPQPLLYPPYLVVMGRALHAVIVLWSPHAELTLVGGTVHHSGCSEYRLQQQQHHQNQQQDVVGLLCRTQTHRLIKSLWMRFTVLTRELYLAKGAEGWILGAHCKLVICFYFINLTLAVGTSCKKISMKLMTLEERKPEAEKSSGDVTLLMAINTSTWETRRRERKPL